MRRWGLGVVLIAGCYRPATEQPCTVACAYTGDRACPGVLECQVDGLCHAPGGGCGDLPDATPLHDVPTQFCHGSPAGLIRICLDADPTTPVALTAGVLDTDTDPRCITYAQGTSHATDVCLLAGTAVSQAAGTTTIVRGSRPLVLLSTDRIDIDGTLDAGAHYPGYDRPAGARTCRPLLASPAAGGAGGTFGSRGGDGGNGATDSGTANGAASPATVPVTQVEGGCDGDAGGEDTGGAGSLGGIGGGAVYLIAQAVRVTGMINASGSGGQETGSYTGGGGGGSGGLIGIDAPMVMIEGKLCANGGAGASGGSMAMGGVVRGFDPDPTVPLSPANPMVVSGGGGMGGRGAVLAMTGFAGVNVGGLSGGGGGGGGGGVFAMYAQSASLQGVISPNPTQP